MWQAAAGEPSPGLSAEEAEGSASPSHQPASRLVSTAPADRPLIPGLDARPASDKKSRACDILW